MDAVQGLKDKNGMDRTYFDDAFDQHQSCEFSIDGHNYIIYKSEVKKMFSIEEVFQDKDSVRLALCSSHKSCLDVKLYNGKSFNEQFPNISVDWLS